MEQYERLIESSRFNGKVRQEHSKSASYERPNPEVVEKPKRRKFSAEYKLKIVREADACKPGEVGALLRRGPILRSST